MAKSNGAARMPAGITESLTPAEEAHIASGGETALAAAAAEPEPAPEPVEPVDPPEPAEPTDPAEPAEPADPAAAAADGRPKMVPHAALHEAREHSKKLETELATLKTRTDQILQAFAEGKLAPTAPAKPDAPVAPALPEIPDLDKDPAGHVIAKMGVLEQAVTTLVNYVTQQHETGTQQSEARQIGNRAIAAEAEFMKVTPDYNDASTFLRQRQDAILTAQGYTDPAERAGIINLQAQNIARRALASNRNPAEVVYTMAKEMGFTAPPPAAGGGAAAAATPGNVTRLETVRAGQAAAGPGLGAARGTGPRQLTAQRLLEMPQAEFDKAIATPEGRAMLGS